jgi:hypothetical protein
MASLRAPERVLVCKTQHVERNVECASVVGIAGDTIRAQKRGWWAE